MNVRELSPSANRSSKPSASISETGEHLRMRSSIDICSGGMTIRGPARRALGEHTAKCRKQSEQIDLELWLVVIARGVGDASPDA